MSVVRDVINHLKNLDPNEIIFFNLVDKDYIVSHLQDQDLEDKYGNPIENLESLVTNDFMAKFIEKLDYDDYLWETFNNSVSDYATETLSKILREQDEDKELWDTETEKTNGNTTA